MIRSKNFGYKNLKSYFLVCFIDVFYFKKISDLLNPSFLVSDVREWLRSLTKNERCEIIAHAGRSPKMSDLERFAQVAQRK